MYKRVFGLAVDCRALSTPKLIHSKEDVQKSSWPRCWLSRVEDPKIHSFWIGANSPSPVGVWNMVRHVPSTTLSSNTHTLLTRRQDLLLPYHSLNSQRMNNGERKSTDDEKRSWRLSWRTTTRSASVWLQYLSLQLLRESDYCPLWLPTLSHILFIDNLCIIKNRTEEHFN